MQLDFVAAAYSGQEYSQQTSLGISWLAGLHFLSTTHATVTAITATVSQVEWQTGWGSHSGAPFFYDLNMAYIIQNNLRRPSSVPCIDIDPTDYIDWLREIGDEVAEAEADGAEMSDGCGEVFARVSDEARGLNGDVLQEESWLGISMTERFKFLEFFAEIEGDGGGGEGGVDSKSGDEVFRSNAACNVCLEGSSEFFEVLPRERASRRLCMAAEVCEKVSGS